MQRGLRRQCRTRTKGHIVTTEHTSRRFDLELEDVRDSIMKMGELAISQFSLALECLERCDRPLMSRVMELGQQVNSLEVEVDSKCKLVLARRQPEANDLRVILTVLKITGDIERMGDQAELIIRRAETLRCEEAVSLPRPDLRRCASLALGMARDALDAFAASDTAIASRVIRQDLNVNEEYRSVTRKLISHMLEDSGYVPAALDVLFVAKAIERIADHAKNIAEYVIFMVKGDDVRHASIEDMEKKAL